MRDHTMISFPSGGELCVNVKRVLGKVQCQWYELIKTAKHNQDP